MKEATGGMTAAEYNAHQMGQMEQMGQMIAPPHMMGGMGGYGWGDPNAMKHWPH